MQCPQLQSPGGGVDLVLNLVILLKYYTNLCLLLHVIYSEFAFRLTPLVHSMSMFYIGHLSAASSDSVSYDDLDVLLSEATMNNNKQIIIIRIYLYPLKITNNDCNITYNKLAKSHK